MIELIYIMDPHCGWCFGFGKVILEIVEKYQNNPSVTFDVKPGGLFHPAILTPKGFANEKRPIVKRIEELSGVKFSEKYITEILGSGSVLNSEPPARAILCMRELNKKLVIPFTEKLLEKEFIYGKNNSLDEVIFETVQEFDIDLEVFKNLFQSTEMKQKILLEFQKVRNITTGYPTLLIKQNGQFTKLASGFAPTEILVKKIDSLLSE
jgi:putative protein-disulfide isomerase